MLPARFIPADLADAHGIAEKAMAADVLEMARLLHGQKLLLVFLVQGQIQPPRAHAESGTVAEGRFVARADNDGCFQRSHRHSLFSFSYLSASNTRH